MKQFALLAALSRVMPLAIAAAVSVAAALHSLPALAQQRDLSPNTSARQVLTQPLIPAPESGDIIIYFQSATRVYFKYPVKAIKFEDGLTVRAVPESEHIVEFTGLSPGRTALTVERKDGGKDIWGVVTVVRDPHEVRIYQQSQINKQTGERRSDSSSNIGGYVSLGCNEIRCNELEPELQPRLPK